MDPPPSTLSSSFMRTMLEVCLTIHAAYGQILLDLLNEVVALRANLVDARGASPPAPPFDESWLPFGNTSQKRKCIVIRGDEIGEMRYLFWCRLYFRGRYQLCFDDVLYMLRGDFYFLFFLCSCFIYFCVLVSQTMIHWLWFILWGYSWYMSFILCFVKTRNLFWFTCIFPHMRLWFV